MNEITLKLRCSVKKIIKILEDQNFKKISEYVLNDEYYIPQDSDLTILSIREILNKAILLRNIKEIFADMTSKKETKITFKKKQFSQNGDIINQEKFDCEITNIEDGRNLIEAIGYKNIMNIKENGIIFTNDEFQIQVKDIINGDKLIEVELIENNEKFNTIDKLKNEISKFNLPIDTGNYFVKKAEIELAKIIK